jgi:hypothetical protein
VRPCRWAVRSRSRAVARSRPLVLTNLEIVVAERQRQLDPRADRQIEHLLHGPLAKAIGY